MFFLAVVFFMLPEFLLCCEELLALCRCTSLFYGGYDGGVPALGFLVDVVLALAASRSFRHMCCICGILFGLLVARERYEF